MKENTGYLLNDFKKYEEKEIPLKEYPRPQMRRDSYFSLNGEWRLAISKEEEIPIDFPLSVIVPFAVESPLSGVNHLLEPDEFLYYRKTVSLPEHFRKERTLLHFDGVDEYCEVYIDRNLVQRHHSGYTPFTVELPFGTPNTFELIVKVKDETDASYHERGKQSLHPKDYFYSSSSGIYKPVWMESLHPNGIESLTLLPLYDEKKVRIEIKTKHPTFAKVSIGSFIYSIETDKMEELPLPSFHPWSVEDPYLYPVEIETESDHISSYFGMRKIETRKVNGREHIYLNDRPIFLSGLLDQGYYFGGNLTPKSYEDYKRDILNAKSYGFNCLRIHVKTECEYFYYLADLYGILLIQDFPNGGSHYPFLPTVLPRVFSFLNDEKKLSLSDAGRENEEGRREFKAEAKEYLQLFYNHPSVAIYTIFNEGWGEFEASSLYHQLKEMDPSRLYDTASGWYHADSDFYSIHTYTFPHMKRKNKTGKAFVISEAGGVSLKVKGHSYYEGIFGHHCVKTKEELEERISRLYKKQIEPQIEEYGLNMLIYTEIADCESEYNGLFTFDRNEKVDKTLIQKLNSSLYHTFEKQFEKQ